MGRGTSTLIAGAAGAVVLPVLALGFALPLWLSAVVAAGVFGGLHLALRPGGVGLDQGAYLEAQTDTVHGLIADGSAALDRLRTIAPKIKDQAMQAAVQNLSTMAAKTLARVGNDPARAMAVRRLLTFYLPNAAGIAEGWQTLESTAQPSPERVQQAREVMKALGEAFAKFANEADAPELQELDLDMKVVNDALKTDLEKTT
jgi:hypothetical protein